ncbi:MAG: signal peptidase II [Anaerolineales bacterium]|nr:signal peptidase II [Anaerolineales bacterium]
MRRYFWDYVLLFSVAGISITLDQWSKAIVKGQLAFGETWMPLEWLAPYARFVHWKNTGAAFGLGQNLNWVFAILACFVIVAIIYYYPEFATQGLYVRITLGLMLGGATGNLIDRVLQGHVTDFISVGTFPVFNIADSSISVGVAVLIVGMLWHEWRQSRHPADGVTETAIGEEIRAQEAPHE